MSAHLLGRILRGYKVHAKQVGSGSVSRNPRIRGYQLEDLQGVFERYTAQKRPPSGENGFQSVPTNVTTSELETNMGTHSENRSVPGPLQKTQSVPMQPNCNSTTYDDGNTSKPKKPLWGASFTFSDPED
jgi:hypothetical protein